MLSKLISTQPERAQPIQARAIPFRLVRSSGLSGTPRHIQDVTITLKTKGAYLSVKRVI